MRRDYRARAAFRLFPAIILATLLGGCAGLLPQSEPAPAVQQALRRSYIENIDMTGRLSVRYQGPQQEEGLHGNFTWNQTSRHTSVSLLSPLGQTVAVVDVMPDSARLTQTGRPPRSAADVDQLTAQTLGWPLPVGSLRHWLQGFVTDMGGRQIVAMPDTGEITTRDGWRIRYANWDEKMAPARPRRMDLSRYTAQAGEVSIRIVIDSWQIH